MAEAHVDGPDDSPEFKVKITGKGVTIDQTVTQDVARQLLNVIFGGTPELPYATAGMVTRPAVISGSTQIVTAGGSRISLAEYMTQVNARRIPEKILAMASYLTDITGQNSTGTFTREDVRKCFRLAAEPMPANYPRDFAMAVQAGWIAAEAPDKDEFFVTNLGRTALQQQFSGDAKRVIRRPRRSGSSAEVTEGTGEDNT